MGRGELLLASSTPQQQTMNFWLLTISCLLFISQASSYNIGRCLFCGFSSFRTPRRAVVELVPGKDSNVTGFLSLEQRLFGVFIRGDIQGLSPGEHGFHVHMTGDTGDSCKAAGGHFNPDDNPHSDPGSEIRHAGDLGNILTWEESTNTWVNLVDNVITLGDGGEKDVAGRAIVVHAGRDDLGRGTGDKAEGSRKTGNAGARVACGIIKLIS